MTISSTLRLRVFRDRRLTLLGRAFLLIGAEICFNAFVWAIAGVSFGHADGILDLALLAWVSGGSSKIIKELTGSDDRPAARYALDRVVAADDTWIRSRCRSYLSN